MHKVFQQTMKFNVIDVLIRILLIFLFLLPSSICQLPLDVLTPNQPIRDGDVLVSSKRRFALGFFSPGNSQRRYVGVWFNNIPNQTIVWVANREHPINGSSGVLSINGHGGLVIHRKNQSTPIWSANVTLASPSRSMAKLLDTRNLVLFESESNQTAVWEGFHHPTDTKLPYMKIGLDKRTGEEWNLTSWKSTDDPGSGSCTVRIDPRGFPQYFLYKGGDPVWRGGPWIGDRFSGIPVKVNPIGVYNETFINNENEISHMYTFANESVITRAWLDESGEFSRNMWNYEKNQWVKLTSNSHEWCDNYGQCGPNSNCDPYKNPEWACTCLPGFEPKSPSDWYSRVGVAGCIRKAGVSLCRNDERFVKVAYVKVPDSSTARVNMSMSLKDCEFNCSIDCSCTAYTSADVRGGGSGCVTWHDDLMDTRTYSKIGQDLYVRVDATFFAQYAKSKGSLSKKAKLAISLGSITAFLLLFTLYWLVRLQRKDKLRRNKYTFELTTRSNYFKESFGGTAFDDSRINSDLIFFHLKTITTATNSFSNENKLGQGGFGSVFKGILYDGTEIAVKRLSKFSGQGDEEFKNEVLLIAKLQHKNLIRMLGCCVEHEEKILVYEYLPNKSLDTFIFDETKRELLNWTKRFEIIFGIARDILYLHEDSRLRIIHRDLKASNVLLDNSLNPKITDFGMARIFKGEQSEANTNRVVGTYGYMSPEYAMEGLFSIKSDVYSFGVLLLEIITGKKNAGYYREEYPNSNLVGHVWELWNENRAVEIIDSSIRESISVSEVIRCIQIALLCVQEFAIDRPTMLAIVSMLGNDVVLPLPRRPAFLLKRMSPSRDPSNSEETNPINDVTCTLVVEGR